MFAPSSHASGPFMIPSPQYSYAMHDSHVQSVRSQFLSPAYPSPVMHDGFVDASHSAPHWASLHEYEQSPSGTHLLLPPLYWLLALQSSHHSHPPGTAAALHVAGVV